MTHRADTIRRVIGEEARLFRDWTPLDEVVEHVENHVTHRRWSGGGVDLTERQLSAILRGVAGVERDEVRGMKLIRFR